MYVERTFTVARPIEDVFDYLGDFTHTNEWDPGTVETTRSAGDGTEGTTYANKSEFLGRKVDLEYTTVTYDKPSQVKFRGTNGRAYATDWLRFTKAGDGSSTEIHYRADFDFGLAINLIAPFYLKPKIEKLADETVEQMTKALQNNAST